MTSHDNPLNEVVTSIPELTPTMQYFARLKKSVVMRDARELSNEAYMNERRLAILAQQYGDDIVTCPLEEALQRINALRLGNYHKAISELTNAREARETYTARLF